MGVYIYSDEWLPWENTVWYWNFDDQNTSQITDFSWNGNNLTWWTMPSYTLVSGSNYAGNYANASSGGWQQKNLDTTYSIFSTIIRIKITQSWQMYFNNLNVWWQYAIIYGYNSWQIELYSYVWSTTKRSTIKSNTALNTWYMIGTTFSSGTSKTYLNWALIWTMTSSNTSLSGLTLWASGNVDRVKWQIWEYIIEDKLRTDAEMSNYYDTIKTKYWLS